MYSSLKQWMNLPVTIHQCLGIDGAGDKAWNAPVVTKCFAEQSAKSIVNKDGIEVVSNTQLYLDGPEIIGNSDEVTFDGIRIPVEVVTAFYDGSTGTKDLLVVYL